MNSLQTSVWYLKWRTERKTLNFCGIHTRFFRSALNLIESKQLNCYSGENAFNSCMLSLSFDNFSCAATCPNKFDHSFAERFWFVQCESTVTDRRFSAFFESHSRLSRFAVMAHSHPMYVLQRISNRFKIKCGNLFNSTWKRRSNYILISINRVDSHSPDPSWSCHLVCPIRNFDHSLWIWWPASHSDRTHSTGSIC